MLANTLAFFRILNGPMRRDYDGSWYRVLTAKIIVKSHITASENVIFDTRHPTSIPAFTYSRTVTTVRQHDGEHQPWYGGFFHRGL